MRMLALLAVGVFAGFVAAAPVPKDLDAKFKKLFGSGHTPEKKGEFKFADGTLTVAFPEKDWVGDSLRPLQCPHTATELKGDFTVTVAMRTTGPATPPNYSKDKDCVLGGGLQAWDGTEKEPKPVFFFRRFSGQGGRKEPPTWYEGVEAHFPRQVFGGERETTPDPTSIYYLRMARAGDTVACWTSGDGKKWVEFGQREVKLPATVSVGVWAYNRTGVAGDVVFEGFEAK